jgi:hypothetical protein
VVEGNSGNTSATFTVSLSSASSHAVAVQYATAPGTAAAGTDYVTAAGTLTFAPGETVKTVTVLVRGDTRYEQGETFFVNLSATGAFVGDGQALGTIANDDPVPVMSVNDVSLTEGDSGTKNLSFTVLLTVASDAPVTVDYATADGSAAAGNDYTATSGTLTFTAGQTSKAVTVVLAGDTALEPSETLFLNLSGVTGAILMDSQAVGTILTDDLSLTIGDITVAEGDDGASAAVFTVSLSAAASFEVQVSYAAANGTAAVGADYVATGGTLVFAPGETTQTITVLAIGDTRNEIDETLFVNLSGAVNALIGDSQGRATILDDDSLPGLSISDALIVEGNAGTKILTFTATLSAASGQNVTVQYASADQGAVAGSDYQAASGLITFGAGSTTRSFNITLNGDAAAEVDETFVVNLTGAVNAIITRAQAIGTIQDDDSLLVEDAVAPEGDEGATALLFNVRLLAPRDHVVSVAYATANGTGIAGTDYLPAAGTLTFLPSETVKSVLVTLIGDLMAESDETLFLNLTSAAGALISDNKATGTIASDDPLPVLTIGDVIVVEGNSGTRNAVFTLALSQASGQAVSVQYATANGAATSGADYQPRSGTVTIGAGGLSTTISVPLVVDAAAEANETFYLNLLAVTGAVANVSQAAALIVDDDPLPALSIGDISATEGNAGAKIFSFTVSLSAAATQTVTVQVATADGTAAAGSDYVAKTEVLTFTPGQTSKVVSVTVNGDAFAEPTETFQVLLSDPTSAVLADAQGIGTIQNDDTTLRVNDITVAEGDDGITTAVFTVSLTGALPADPVSVNYATGNGTAAAGSDYVGSSGRMTFAPGETSRTISLVVLGDAINENSETFFVNLSGAVSAAIADGQGMATIVDAADPVPALTIDDVNLIEGAAGTKNLTFTARLSAPSGKTVTVNYATADGTANAGSDYTLKTGTLTFNPGITAVAVSVVVAGDTSAEADESFFINLSAAANAVIADAEGIGTIRDDDSLVVGDVAVVEGDAGTSVARFTVRLLVARPEPVSVDYAAANGTAAAGIDYLPIAGTLTFAPGETVKTVDVAVVGDRLDEIHEAFFLNLSKPAGAILADAQAAATITDDDDPPPITLTGGIVVAEGNAGTKTVTFTVRLSAPSGQNVTLQYATADGTAAAGSDYLARSGVLTISAGQTLANLTITINGDTSVEGDESFVLRLSNPVNAILTDAEGSVTIVDDETLGGGLDSMSIANVLAANALTAGDPLAVAGRSRRVHDALWALIGSGLVDLPSAARKAR